MPGGKEEGEAERLIFVVMHGWKNKRQYKKHIGRVLTVRVQDESFEGNLTEANDQAITLEWKAREPKPIGKGKVTVQKKKSIDYTNINEAKVVIKF